jgi:hypothetical protein
MQSISVHGELWITDFQILMKRLCSSPGNTPDWRTRNQLSLKMMIQIFTRLVAIYFILTRTKHAKFKPTYQILAHNPDLS